MYRIHSVYNVYDAFIILDAGSMSELTYDAWHAQCIHYYMMHRLVMYMSNYTYDALWMRWLIYIEFLMYDSACIIFIHLMAALFDAFSNDAYEA